MNELIVLKFCMFRWNIIVFLWFSKNFGPSKKFIKFGMKGGSNENVTNYILVAFYIVINNYGMKKLLVRVLGFKFAFQKNVYHAGVTWDSKLSTFIHNFWHRSVLPSFLNDYLLIHVVITCLSYVFVLFLHYCEVFPKTVPSHPPNYGHYRKWSIYSVKWSVILFFKYKLVAQVTSTLLLSDLNP